MSEEINQGEQDAPQLNKLAASQQGGNRGAQLWGVRFNGTVNTIYQTTPGGSWSEWRGNDWAGPGFPQQVYELAAAQHSNNCVQFWGLDSNLKLWTTSQSSPGGDWVPWSGPGWNNAPTGMKRVTACRQGGTLGTQLWGIAEDLSIITCYQQTPGGNWSAWQKWQATPQNSQFIEIAAAEQNGHAQLWALDTKQQLWCCWQTTAGQSWVAWHGPNWNGAPNLANITACQQGGTRGSQIWGITPDYTLISNYQITPGGQWSGWSQGSWLKAPQVYELTAALQNNGCIEFWALTLNQELITISQTSPGGDWGEWSQMEQMPD
jgi:hypothetical protein